MSRDRIRQGLYKLLWLCFGALQGSVIIYKLHTLILPRDLCCCSRYAGLTVAEDLEEQILVAGIASLRRSTLIYVFILADCLSVLVRDMLQCSLDIVVLSRRLVLGLAVSFVKFTNTLGIHLSPILKLGDVLYPIRGFNST